MDRIRTFLLALATPVAERPARLRVPRWSILLEVDGVGRLEWLVGDRSDFEILNELLVGEEYRFDLLAGLQPRYILDLGAHSGASVLWFAKRHPEARIWAVEPDPRTVSRLRHNVGHLHGVDIIEAAVTGVQDGTVQFFPARQGWASALVPHQRSGPAVSVRAIRLDDLLDQLGVPYLDLLKIDIEGAELDVLRNARRLGDIETIVGELHGDVARQRDVVALLAPTFDVVADYAPGHCTFCARRRGPRRLE